MIGDFHFLRPWAFTILLPGALLLWLIWGVRQSAGLGAELLRHTCSNIS